MSKKTKSSVRERILNVADRLFYEQGYRNTGINQIIDEAGVAKASLYYHFPAKEDLCLAYLHEKHESWNRRFRDFILGKENQLTAPFDFLEEDNVANDFRGCGFINMLAENPTGSEEIFKVLRQHKTELQQHFVNQVKVGKEELGFGIYCLFENAIIESQLFKSNSTVKRIRSVVEAYFEGILKVP